MECTDDEQVKLENNKNIDDSLDEIINVKDASEKQLTNDSLECTLDNSSESKRSEKNDNLNECDIGCETKENLSIDQESIKGDISLCHQVSDIHVINVITTQKHQHT